MNKQFALAVMLATAPLAASAGDHLSYNYIEGAYSESTVEFDGGDADLDGFALKGSMAMSDNFYGAFGVHQDKFDSDNLLEPWELTVGYNKTLGGSTTDFITEVSYIGANSKLDGVKYHNDGYRAAVGVRSAIGKRVELGAKVTYTGVEAMDSLVGVNVHGQVKFNQTWGIFAQYHYNEFNFIDGDISNWQVGVRASF